MKRIVVIGGGFAGLWSAIGAARKLDEQGASNQVEVVMINPHAHHSIRVRNYEADLAATLVPLSDVLGPVGVQWIQGAVTDIDVAGKQVTLSVRGRTTPLTYDKLVLASGSRLVDAPIRGLADHAFNVDTYEGAERLERRLLKMVHSHAAGSLTFVVIGSGLTGVEVASELPHRVRDLLAASGEPLRESEVRVMLIERAPRIAMAMGGAQPVIEQALTQLGVEMMTDVEIEQIDDTGMTLAGGKRVDASTIIWCGGMHASPLTRCIPVERDALGRVPVDENLRVKGVSDVFAAGDVARALFEDGKHESVMSCQHSRPMGRFAGHNVVCDLLGLPMLPLNIDWYTTILDLGAWGAVYTEGWERRLAAQGQQAKNVKRVINTERIYPPRTGNRADLFAAAAPIVQAPPPIRG